MMYYKKVDGEFIGFYDEVFNKEKLFTEGKLNENFYELPKDKWRELINGQCEGKVIRILKNGELGLYQVPPLEVYMLKPIFNYDTEQWEETATNEELLEHYKTKLIEVQKEIKLVEELGLMPSKEQLALKSQYMNSHIEVCHEIALTLN